MNELQVATQGPEFLMRSFYLQNDPLLQSPEYSCPYMHLLVVHRITLLQGCTRDCHSLLRQQLKEFRFIFSFQKLSQIYTVMARNSIALASALFFFPRRLSKQREGALTLRYSRRPELFTAPSTPWQLFENAVTQNFGTKKNFEILIPLVQWEKPSPLYTSEAGKTLVESKYILR